MTYLIIRMDREEVGRRYNAWNVIRAEVYATDETEGGLPVIGTVVWYRGEGAPILDLAYLDLAHTWSAIADSYEDMSSDDRSALASMLHIRSMSDSVEDLRVWSRWCAEMRIKQPVPPRAVWDEGDD
jgi:hypothetical protein